ncbi:MAG: M67 family metallopeptidase [Gemmataceae bacterium]
MNCLILPRTIRDEMLALADRERPCECCGLLLGKTDPNQQSSSTFLASTFWPLVNELHSPTAFRSEPRSLFEAYRRMRSSGEAIVAVYHSHPTSEAVPSRRDREELTYPDALTVIAGSPRNAWEIRAWRWGNDGFAEVGIDVIESSPRAIIN